jgi:hypothetical protein
MNKLGSRWWSDVVFERRRVETRNSKEMNWSGFLLPADSVGQMGSLRWRGEVIGAGGVDTG